MLFYNIRPIMILTSSWMVHVVLKRSLTVLQNVEREKCDGKIGQCIQTVGKKSLMVYSRGKNFGRQDSRISAASSSLSAPIDLGSNQMWRLTL